MMSRRLRELLPVILPQRKNTFRRVMVAAELTDAGKQSLVCRIEDDPQEERGALGYSCLTWRIIRIRGLRSRARLCWRR